MKGQGATEYMVLIAAVIFVVLIIIAILSGFLDQQQNAKISQSKAYWMSQTPFNVVEESFSGSSVLIKLKNVGSKKIELVSIEVDDENITAVSLPSNVSSGEEYIVEGNLGANSISCEAGELREYNLEIWYKNSGDITLFSLRGSNPLIIVCG